MDNNHSNYNLSSYIIPQQSQLQGFSIADVRSRSFDFQRELEKERIRARIISEEIIRRRILEEEVRREIMLQRELGHRVPLLANLEHLGGFDTKPFQLGPLVSGRGSRSGNGVTFSDEVTAVLAPPEGTKDKDKVIMLAKPSLVDIKRKAITPPVGGASKVSKKQKTNEDWSCALCRISTTSEQGFNEHLQGKKHKARERGIVSERTGFGITSTPTLKNKNEDGDSSLEIFHNVPTPNPSGVHDNHTLAKLMKTFPERENGAVDTSATYEVCGVGSYTLKVFNEHKKGKKHLAKLSVLNKTSQKALMVEDKKAEMGPKETKERVVGEKKETNKDNADSDVNRDEEYKMVPKIVHGETVVPKTKGGIEEVETNRDPVVTRSEPESGTGVTSLEIKEFKGVIALADGSTDKFTISVKPNANKATVASKINEGMKEQVETNRNNADIDDNQLKDQETVLEKVSSEMVALKTKGIEELVETNNGDFDSDKTSVKYKETVLEVVGGETMALKTKGVEAQEETNIDNVDSDENRVEDKEAIFERLTGETVDPNTNVQESVCEEVS